MPWPSYPNIFLTLAAPYMFFYKDDGTKKIKIILIPKMWTLKVLLVGLGWVGIGKTK